MALTAAQRAYYDAKIGTGWDEADLETRLARLHTDAAVVVEILEIRLATMINTPGSFTIPGEYSQDTRANLSVLREALRDARADATAGEDLDESLVYVQAPANAPSAVILPDTEERVARGRYAWGR